MVEGVSKRTRIEERRDGGPRRHELQIDEESLPIDKAVLNASAIQLASQTKLTEVADLQKKDPDLAVINPAFDG